MYISPFTLSNGIKYHRLNFDDNIISCALIVKSGSLRDSRSGEAHFVEHMLLDFLRLNQKYNQYSISKRLNVSGKTSFDRTCYYFACINEMFTEVLRMMKDIINGSYLDKRQFEEVRQEIIDEFERNYPIIFREEAFLKCATAELGWNMPIGCIDDIKIIQYEDVKEYFFREYITSNLALGIVGNADDKLVDKIMSSNLMPVKTDTPCKSHSETDNTNVFNVPASQAHLMIRLPGQPLTPITDINDSLSLSFISEILKQYPSPITTYIGIKEYTRSRRFLSLTCQKVEEIEEILNHIYDVMCNQRYISSIVHILKDKAVDFLLRQNCGSEILCRIEDSFVYNSRFLQVTDVANRIPSIPISYVNKVIDRFISSKKYIVSDAGAKEIIDRGAKCEKNKMG